MAQRHHSPSRRVTDSAVPICDMLRAIPAGRWSWRNALRSFLFSLNVIMICSVRPLMRWTAVQARRHLLPGMLGSLALLPAPCAAEDQAPRNLPLSRFVDVVDLSALADMVVTDTKVAQPRDSATQRIEVLQERDMERLPGDRNNLAELLRYTSGQFVNVLSRNDANWGSYAGLGPKYNTWLLDGQPIDAFVDAMSLDAAAIERIEVHKGPASVLYSNVLSEDFAGNEAPLAGTTNFVLRNRIDQPLARFTVGGGSWATRYGRAYAQGRIKDVSYAVGASIEGADYRQYGRVGSWLQTVAAPAYRTNRLFANLAYALPGADQTVTLFVHHADHEGDMGRPNRDFDHHYDTVNLSYQHALSADWHVQFAVGERRYDRDFGNDNYPASLALLRRETTRQTIRPADLTLSYRHGDGGLLTLGADAQRAHYRVDASSPGQADVHQNDVHTRSTGYFIQEKLHWRDWVLRAGIRRNEVGHDYGLLGGSQPVTTSASWHKDLWSAGVRYNAVPGLALYANAGSSFMVPSAKLIGGTIRNPLVDAGEFANPNLKPESGLGRDVGFEWQALAALQVGVRGFVNSVGSAIVTSVVNASPSQSRSENAGGTRSAGIEVDLRYAPDGGATWFANLTRTRSRVDMPLDPDQDGTEIPFAPDTVLNLGLSMDIGDRLTLSPYGQWVGRYYDSASRPGRSAFGQHAVASLRARYRWSPAVDLVIDLNNLTDRRYAMPWDFRDPGFNASASLRMTF